MTHATRSLPLWLPFALAAATTAPAAEFIQWARACDGLDLGAGKGVVELAAGGSPAIVYAVVDGVGLARSDDQGKTWTVLKGDSACLASPYTVTASPVDGNLVFASIATPGGGLWRSTDGGKTWAQCGAKAKDMASDDIEWVTVCAKDPKLILAGHRAGSALSVSADGGETWMTKNLGAEIKGQLPLMVDDCRWVVASRADKGLRLTTDSGNNWSDAQGSVDYFAGPLPMVQTGEAFFSSKHHGFNKSLDGAKGWQFVMEHHTRVVGTAGERIFRENRYGIRGTDDRILALEMSDNLGQSWGNATGSLLNLVPEALRPNLVISNKVDPFAHVRIATAWVAAPDGITFFLALGKAGLYRGKVMASPKGPLVLGPQVQPVSVPEGDTRTPVTIATGATGKLAKVKRVVADLSILGGQELELLDDGQHGDGAAGDKMFGNSFTLAKGVSPGEKVIGIVAEDEGGRVGSATAVLTVSGASEKMLVWDGEKFASGLSWIAPQTPLNFFKAQSDEAHSGKIGLAFHGEGAGYVGGGWNWHGWYPENSGDDIRKFRNLSFWVKAECIGEQGGISVSLNCSGTKDVTGTVNLLDYQSDALDGKWHEVVIPLQDIYAQKQTKFDPARAWELDLSTWAPHDRTLTLYLDDIGFDNRNVRPHSVWVTEPEERAPAPLGENVASVAAEVDLKADGLPISPWIYGAAMGDCKAAQEMGLTILRAGGNPVSPANWKTGFGSKGADWFYQNDGAQTPPEKNWLLTFHGENRKSALETYLTIPMMGRVAKDNTGVPFDIKKYPDQENWAGKAQPTDRLPNAGNGRQLVKGEDGKPKLGKDGKPVYQDVEPDPNDTSVEMPPEEQAAMLKFMIENMGYGPAAKGGVKYVALDNEPMLWASTHRGMHPKGTSYDELWERTKTYASLYKKIDPDVKIAGATFWGWTAYFYSGLDSQQVGRGQGTWDDPPDFVAHGKVPLTKWFLTKLKEHEKATGERLVDILDWHFYPQTGIYMAGKAHDPKVMEGRVQETRVLWDPTWKDPTWMGKETGKVIKLVRLMKEWIAECNPGLQTSIGEYSFGGEDDISGGIAQAEILGVFAREGLDYAFYWFFPPVNKSTYFAYKMFRNPDGKRTAFGDRYLPSTCSAPDDVSVHVAKDTKSGKLTFILVNKRVAKGAKVALKLSAPVPEQDVAFYEYSNADRFCIGQHPARKVSGDQFEVALPPFSVVRFDVKP